MAQISWDKQQRAMAKENFDHLIALAVDGQYANTGGFAFTGPATKAEAEIIWNAFRQLNQVRNKRINRKVKASKP